MFFFCSFKSVSFRRKYFKSGRKVCKVWDKHLITVGPLKCVRKTIVKIGDISMKSCLAKVSEKRSFFWISWTFKGFKEKCLNYTLCIEVWAQYTHHLFLIILSLKIPLNYTIWIVGVACFCALEGIIFESSLLSREDLSCFQKDHAMVYRRE